MNHIINHVKIIRLIKKISLPLIGLISLLWFLIRVIPKPSRANYPCQRAAFPFATSFIIWLTSMAASVTLFKKVRYHLGNKKILRSVFLIFPAILLFFMAQYFQPVSFSFAGIIEQKDRFVPTDEPNSPAGEAKGIYPGRVVWAYNPDATSWNGTSGYWWEDNNTNQLVVDSMLSDALRNISGADEDTRAWAKIFTHFNKKHDKGETGYIPGEKIAVKLNMNTCNSNDGYQNNSVNSSPHVVFALVSQLIEYAGVAAEDIILYDNSRFLPKTIYNKIEPVYPGITYIDKNARADWITSFTQDENCKLAWSQKLTLENGGGHPTYLPGFISNASYIINLGNLKGHDLAGVTMCAKNHVGTILATNPDKPNLSPPRAAGFHPYATVHDFDYWKLPERPMGTYNTLVDLMGHKDLGGKTLLFIVDALYASVNQHAQIDKNSKWQMSPFNGDWPSSIFVSQDGVAIESVGLDFLRSEPTQVEVYGSVDNYLHEASQAGAPPSGTFYDPEGDGTAIQSLGVHEHWNNEQDKQYSRNLGSGEGIELILATKKDNNQGQQPMEIDSPENLSVNLVQENIKLFWIDNADNEDAFIIEYAVGNEDDFTTLDTVSLNTTQYLFPAYEEGQIYFFKVRAIAQGYASDYSNTATIHIEEQTGISKREGQIKIDLHPAGNFILVRSTGRQLHSVSLYSLNGTCLYKDSRVSKTVYICTQQLSAGMYLVQVISRDSKVYRQKVMKK